MTVAVMGYSSFARRVGFSLIISLGRRNQTIWRMSTVMWLTEDNCDGVAVGNDTSQGKERPMPVS